MQNAHLLGREYSYFQAWKAGQEKTVKKMDHTVGVCAQGTEGLRARRTPVKMEHRPRSFTPTAGH